MAKNRTPAEREAQRLVIIERIARGESQRSIAADLGISQPQVSYVWRSALAEWRTAARATMDNKVAEELLKLSIIEREAWDAWEASKQPQTTRRTVASGAQQGAATRLKLVEEQSTALPDPAYLLAAARVIERRIKLLGLDAPTKHVAVAAVATLGDDAPLRSLDDPAVVAAARAFLMVAYGNEE